MDTPKPKLLFVINPISGGKSKVGVPELIKEHLDHRVFDYEILWWKTSTDVRGEVHQFAERPNSFGVVAVGGDGTINYLASIVFETKLTLGIIPQGSGNGLARALKIPLKIDDAIRLLSRQTIKSIDLGFVNDKVFVNVAGCGFDAHVSHLFAQLPKRGLKSYVQAILKSYRQAPSIVFNIDMGDRQIEEDAFMLSIANGNQWGNEFYVAPDAKYDDGLLDLVFLKKPKIHQLASLVLALIRKRPHRLITRYTVNNCAIHVDPAYRCHLDGEPWEVLNDLQVHLAHKALRVFAA